MVGTSPIRIYFAIHFRRVSCWGYLLPIRNANTYKIMDLLMSSQCRTTVLPKHRVTLLKSSILVGSLMIAQGGVAEPARSASQWQPDPPKYEFELAKDLDVQMDDGVHLRADVYY